MTDTIHYPNPDQSMAARSQSQRDLSYDQLEYMADLIAEFRDMSSTAGLTTLAGILALAQSEAALQLSTRRKG